MLSVAWQVRVGRRVAHFNGEPVVGHVEGLELLGPDEPHRASLGVENVDQFQGNVLDPGNRTLL